MMEANEFALGEREFERIRERAATTLAGISLSDAKRTLVIARLSKIVRTMKARELCRVSRFSRDQGHGADAQEFVNALTTNLTRFWREEHHFAHLIDSCRGSDEDAHAASASKRLRIWSAGCSTGQEPYTIALSLLGGASRPQALGLQDPRDRHRYVGDRQGGDRASIPKASSTG